MDVNEKYMLTVKEAAEYYNIGTKSLRRIVENGEKKFAVYCTNKVMIIRRRFEEYLDWCCDNNIPVGELVDVEKDAE